MNHNGLPSRLHSCSTYQGEHKEGEGEEACFTVAIIRLGLGLNCQASCRMIGRHYKKEKGKVKKRSGVERRDLQLGALNGFLFPVATVFVKKA